MTFKTVRITVAVVLVVLGLALGGLTWGYPLDGYDWTGIRRLKAFQLVQEGKLRGRKLEPGALLGSEHIKIRLAGVNESYDILPTTPLDPRLQAGLEEIFDGRSSSYYAAVLDLTDPTRPRFAAVRPDRGYTPGSVGKLLIMTGLFDQLRKRFPNDTEARARFLRETRITADEFVIPNSHSVPIVADSFKSVSFRSVRVGDEFTLWEWLDHMVSPSSNAAASMTWKSVLMLDLVPQGPYPSPEQEAKLLKETPKSELTQRAADVLDSPLRKVGIDIDKLKLRSFFTRTASRTIPVPGGSYSTPRELVRWMLKMEQGKLVDRWSSQEMKRMLYFTRNRYRYASSSALDDSAVYFKSGSLYQCRPEEGYTCGKYKGNRVNLMHSVAIVETAPGEDHPRLHYLVSMMSNVLKVNSAWEHSVIAKEIHNLIRSQN